MNKKILSLFVLLVIVLGATKAFASLTFSSAAITGDAASTIDVGAGNALSLQTTNNGAITTGTGMVTLGSSLTIPTTTSSTTGVIFKGANRFIHNFALAGTDGQNTFVGINAGNFTMTGSTGSQGSYNTAVGDSALSSNTTGLENTALGSFALNANTTGTSNIAIGDYTLSANTTGSFNIGIGSYSFLLNTTGIDNTAIGHNVLATNTTGSDNTIVGFEGLVYNTTGSKNTVIGGNALYFSDVATSNTAVGYNAGSGNVTHFSNQGGVYLGYQSGYKALTGSDYNTLIGYQSGYGVTSGARNVVVGNSTISASQNQITTGSNNISIGNDVAVASATASNQLDIGNLIYGTALDGTGATISTGNIGIGTKAPQAKLDINSNSFILETAQTPATAASACITGSIAWDSGYVYVCVATNTWKRSAITTW
ncbi:MAG: hypothetical protein WC793_01185 [Candidatus Paceibacterota bacterium]|jgi:hypothetical protein